MSPRFLERLETYYDGVLRGRAEVVESGPFTLFVATAGTGFYARPRLHGTEPITAADVIAVLARQRELGMPQAIEWVHESTPTLLGAVREAGVDVEECPLLVLEGAPPAVTAPGVRLVPHDDASLSLVRAAVHVGFGSAGTTAGPVGTAERDAVGPRAESDARQAASIAEGLSVLVGVHDPVDGPVGGGSHHPRDGVTEIVGVAVLPTHRRRGLAAAITSALALDALDRGITTVFCSAQDDDVARVYERVGFRRVGTACIAELP